MLHPYLTKTVNECFKLPKQEGDFGIEMEIEGQRLPPAPSGWTIKEENSLRGEAYEYVTRNAVHMNSLQKSLANLHKALTAEPVTVNLTTRASTHIHLNMQNETFRTLFGTILLYCIAEPMLLRICGQHRNGNLFCLPLVEGGDLPSHFKQMVYSFGDKELTRHHWPHRGKYAALNIDPLNSLGSIEFRMFPNTIDPEDVMRWARWVYALREYAKNYPDETYLSLFTRLYRNPDDIIQIFRTQPDFNQIFPMWPDQLVHHGLEFAYEAHKPLMALFENVEKVQQKKKPKKVSMEAFEDFRFADRDLINLNVRVGQVVVGREAFNAIPPAPRRPRAT